MTDPTALADDLRESLRPLWRRFNAARSLSAGKLGILAQLDQRGALTVTDLSATERISHQAVATAVKDLASLGLVSRAPDPADGRRVVVTLTGSGRDRLAVERTAGQEWLISAIWTELDDDERAALAAALPLLRRLDTREPQ